MAGEKLVFDVLAKASGAADVQKLGRAIDDVGKSADNLNKKDASGFFTKFTASAKDAGSKIGTALTTDLKTNLSKTGGFFTNLPKEAAEAGKRAASALGSAITGASKSGGKKIFGFFKDLPGEAAEAGTKAASKLGKAITDGLSNLGPGGAYVGGALVAGVVAASPLIAAALTGALIAGVAAAGIGAAVMLQLKSNSEVKGAFTDLGTQIKTSLTQATAGFAPELIKAASSFSVAWQASTGNIKTFFANLAPTIGPFVDKLGTAFQGLTKGLADMSVAFGPVMDALGSGLAGTLETLGTAFTNMGSQGAAAATALQLVFGAFNGMLGGLLQTIAGLTAAFGWLAEHGVLGPQVQASYEGYKTSIDAAKSSQQQLGTAVQTTSSLMQEQANQIKAETDPMFGLINAQVQLTQKQQAYNDAIKQHGANSLEAKAASGELLQATSNLSDASAKAADAGFNGKLTPAMRLAMEAAGLTKEQIDGLEQQTMKAHDQLKALEGTYTAHVVTIFTQIGKPSSETTLGANTYKGLARGGIVNGRGMVHARKGLNTQAMVARGGSNLIHWAERGTGGEAFIPRRGNKARSRSLATTVVEDWLGGHVQWPGSGGGGSPANAQPVATGSSSGGGGMSGSAMLAELRAMVAAIQDMSINLDGRQLGSIQGREQSLYARTR